MTIEELQETTCEEYCSNKFDRGKKEHKQKWDYNTIKPLWELLEEYADAINYASLVAEKYPTLGKKHMKICKELWTDIKSHIIIFKQ